MLASRDHFRAGPETQVRRDTDGGGFEPPVPFGTHAFQACTINHSVTHPSVAVVPYNIGNTTRRRLNSKSGAKTPRSPKHFVRNALESQVRFAKLWECALVIASLFHPG